MTALPRDGYSDELAGLIGDAGVSRQQTADALTVPIDTVHAWLKPPTSKSARPAPEWAVKLFRYCFSGRLQIARARQAASQKN